MNKKKTPSHLLPGILFLAIAGILIVTIYACSNVNDLGPVDCTGQDVAYTDANSIIQSSCATNSGCHGSGSHEGPGELLTYNQIYNARSLVRSAVASGRMPIGRHMSTADRTTIVCWIENGAQDK